MVPSGTGAYATGLMYNGVDLRQKLFGFEPITTAWHLIKQTLRRGISLSGGCSLRIFAMLRPTWPKAVLISCDDREYIVRIVYDAHSANPCCRAASW